MRGAVSTLIRSIADADAAAGAASHIAVQTFNDSETLTALRNGSGNLELIGWHTPPGDAGVTRAAYSSTQAGTAQEVALALMGRRAVTAVRGGSGTLLPISWDVPPGLGAITRTWDIGTAAGDASLIATATVGADLSATSISAGDGLVIDNVQPYPMFGWLEARWVPIVKTTKPPLTTANVNQWLKSVLADPARARQLKDGWVELLIDEFTTTKEQVESLALIPADHAKDLQTAIGRVVDHGGTIVVERDSEDRPGKLIITPRPASPNVAELSVGVFHCTFNAHCRKWKCGWGPAKK